MCTLHGPVPWSQHDPRPELIRNVLDFDVQNLASVPGPAAPLCAKPRLTLRLVLSFGHRALSIQCLSYISCAGSFWMILHINHIQPERVALTSSVVSTLISIAGEARIPPRVIENLNVHLDWVQYKANFREAVTLRRATRGEEVLPFIEIGVDLRQLDPKTLKGELVNALQDLTDGSRGPQKRAYLESFTPVRSSLIWRFNDLFWQHLPLWEAASGKGYEQALPSGKSDANHAEAVADAVADFWTLLKDLENHNQLPPEIFVLEIGVGTGKRAALWLDRFRSLDAERGTQYYPRIRFLPGDSSMPTLTPPMEK